jgi:imidazolonepropionase-like amidohydrolase
MAPSSGLLIREARVFTGTETLPPASVLVRDGVIASLDAGDDPPEHVAVVDGRGRTVLPGLIDAHTHAFQGNLEQAIVFGVTTELDMLADPGEIFALRERAAECHDMADVRSAGTGATVPGGYPWYLVELGYLPPFPTLVAPFEAEAFVAARVAEGSDHIKIFIDDGRTIGQKSPTLDRITVEALVHAAHEAERKVVVHALSADAAQMAVDAGADVLGHLFVDRLCTPELVEQIAARDVAVIPTLAVLHALFGPLHGPELLADARVGPYLDAQSRAYLEMERVQLGEGAVHDIEVAVQALARLKQAGVTILAGSDAGNGDTAHGATLHLELRLLVEAGLSAREALSGATAAVADRFGLDDRGRIEPGLRADLVLVDGNPETNIDSTLNIVGVWRGGVRVDREAFRAAAVASDAPDEMKGATA